MHPDWLATCKTVGAFIDESEFGKQYDETPFRGKSFMLTSAFATGKKQDRLDLCTKLIEVSSSGMAENEKHSDMRRVESIIATSAHILDVALFD